MTPEELKEARHKLGLSARGLATALDMGQWGGRTVRRWEKEGPVPGPVAVAVRFMLQSSQG